MGEQNPQCSPFAAIGCCYSQEGRCCRLERPSLLIIGCHEAEGRNVRVGDYISRYAVYVYGSNQYLQSDISVLGQNGHRGTTPEDHAIGR